MRCVFLLNVKKKKRKKNEIAGLSDRGCSRRDNRETLSARTSSQVDTPAVSLKQAGHDFLGFPCAITGKCAACARIHEAYDGNLRVHDNLATRRRDINSRNYL